MLTSPNDNDASTKSSEINEEDEMQEVHYQR